MPNRSPSSFASIATASTPTTRRSSSRARATASRARPAVADVLERRGTRVSGAILIGLALPLGSTTARTADRAVRADLHGDRVRAPEARAELQADLQAALRKAEAWATTRYEPALARRDALSDAERAEVDRRARALHRLRRERDRSQDAHHPDAAVQRATAARARTASSAATTAG